MLKVNNKSWTERSSFYYLHLQKIFVNACILCQFRMKAGGEQAALPGGNYSAVAFSKNFDFRTHSFNPRGTDKNEGNSVGTDGRDDLLSTEAVQLSTIGIAANFDIHGSQIGFFTDNFSGQQDQSGTSAPDS